MKINYYYQRLKSLTKDKIIISTSRGKKNTNRSNIRNIDNKLYMNKDLYNKYTKLIAYEIDNNSLKRYQLLNQKISKIIDKNKFSQNENIEIIRINSSL